MPWQLPQRAVRFPPLPRAAASFNQPLLQMPPGAAGL